MKLSIDTKDFAKSINNLLDYSSGYIQGAQEASGDLLQGIGRSSIEIFKEYIDSSARANPAALQHVYEWYMNGSPNARLFDINYQISGKGLSFSYQFRQSTSIQNGSKTPFYDKARIMEEGIPVTIVPKESKVLSFNVDGEQVFTKQPIKVSNPGGIQAEGAFSQALDAFIKLYFSQAFLNSSGIQKHLKDHSEYRSNIRSKNNLSASLGKSVGHKWMIKTGELI